MSRNSRSPTQRTVVIKRTTSQTSVRSTGIPVRQDAARPVVTQRPVAGPSGIAVPQPASRRPQAKATKGIFLPMHFNPDSPSAGSQMLSSPYGLRESMETGRPGPGLQRYKVMPQPGHTRQGAALNRPDQDRQFYSGILRIASPITAPVQQLTVDPALDRRMIGPDFSFVDSPAHTATPPRYMRNSPLATRLSREVFSTPGASARGVGRAVGRSTPPVMATSRGVVPADTELTIEKTVDRTDRGEHVHKHFTRIQSDGQGGANKLELDVQNLDPDLSPIRALGPLHEVVSVTSSIAIGLEGKQFSKLVSHEITERPVSAIDTSKLKKLVREESKDVVNILKMAGHQPLSTSPDSKAIRRRIKELGLDSESASALQKTLEHTHEDEEDIEEMQPEVAAAIMHTEEKGMRLDVSPNKMYQHLFPKGSDPEALQNIDLSSVVPAPHHDVVVPVDAFEALFRSGITPEVEEAAKDAKKTRHQPVTDIFSESVLHNEQPKVSNIAKGTGKHHSSVLDDATPPWANEDILELSGIIGAEPSNATPTFLTTEPSFKIPPDSSIVDYLLVPGPPKYYSRVQLRGSQQPPWFSGFYVALPDTPNGIRTTKTPEDVLFHAWNAVQPTVFPDNSFVAS